MIPIDVTLYIGGVFATDREAVVRTVLGSCIAACLYDPVSRVGGMNHFVLPLAEGETAKPDQTRFGLHAMEVLIGSIQRLGGRRERLLAKLFGGGHVLRTALSAQSVPTRNIAFIEDFVREENIRVVSKDLGGHVARRVHFYPHDGRALMKHLPPREAREVERRELRFEKTIPPRPPSDITLFDD